MFPKIVNFKSLPKKNYFAPEWDYYIIENIIKKVNFKSLSKFLLKKEKELLKITKPILKASTVDGYTGLGENSITSRYASFNVFNFKNKELYKISKEIINIHKTLLNFLKIETPKNLWIQCWFNVMRKGEFIKPHSTWEVTGGKVTSFFKGKLTGFSIIDKPTVWKDAAGSYHAIGVFNGKII